MAMSAGDSALKAAAWPAASREAAMAPSNVSFILRKELRGGKDPLALLLHSAIHKSSKPLRTIPSDKSTARCVPNHANAIDA